MDVESLDSSSMPAQLMQHGAKDASSLLKSLSNQHRLVLLCLMAEKERSVSELEAHLHLRQATVSQQLARLRADNLVATRRSGAHIYYSLKSPQAKAIIQTLYTMYCHR